MTLEGEVVSVRSNGWGVLVTVDFLDRGATYSGQRVRRNMQYMVSPDKQPKVGQKIKLTLEEA